LVCTALTGAFLAMAFDVILAALRLHGACAHYRQGTREVQGWIDRLRRDVRNAVGPAPLPDDLPADAPALALACPDGSVVVHRLDGGRVVRDLRRAGLLESETLVRTVESLAFSLPAAPDRPRLLHFSLRLARRSAHGRIDPVFDGLAAFRSAAR
jgi:hypothetical protein